MTSNIRVLALGALLLSTSAVVAQTPAPAAPPAPALVITSTAFEDGGVIPDKYTQNSPNPVSPALSWENAPAKTVSFTLIMHDVDTLPRPTGPDNLHWMLINIPATAKGLPEGVPAVAVLPDGTLNPLTQSGRKIGYLGMGAPKGPYHHYIYELYALDIKLPAPSTEVPVRDEILKAMDGHVLAKAAYVGRFHR
jgi:Raf kinase inhibitor-like YbhB/YbcL family protein